LFPGISRSRISCHKDSDEAHSKRKPVFENKPPMKTVEATEVMQHLQADLVNLTRLNKDNCKHVLNVVDVFSRYMWLRPIPDKKCETITTEIRKLWKEVGTPRILQSDNGSEFIGDNLKTLCQQKNVKQAFGGVGHPQAQGKVLLKNIVIIVCRNNDSFSF
jgi:transposase InsO family protein